MKLAFPFVAQQASTDCGIACLQMIAQFYGIDPDAARLRQACGFNDKDLSLLALQQGAAAIGLDTISVKMSYEQLSNPHCWPCIVVWQGTHFVVVYKRTDDHQAGYSLVHIADPSVGLYVVPDSVFIEHWTAGHEKGYCLLCNPR